MQSSVSPTDGSQDRLEARRRRVLFRAWRRGMRETDLILGRFADARLAALSDRDLADMELLMDVPDHDLFAWVTGAAPVSANHDTPLLRAIIAFHGQGRETA